MVCALLVRKNSLANVKEQSKYTLQGRLVRPVVAGGPALTRSPLVAKALQSVFLIVY